VYPASQRAEERSLPEPVKVPTADQLSLKVQQNLILQDDNSPASPTTTTSPEGSAIDLPDATANREVGELAGYLDQLYLPRQGVSVDAALMVELMYT